ncbi:MAG: hypothetical protein GY798_34550 [Hyphomicrobiales bacterium]|nr:hypothetical protein [Hyphomicrobiales bacterium]
MTGIDVTLYFAVGTFVGVAHLAGLWLTVSRLRRCQRPLAILALSGLARMALLLVALALITGLEWRRLVACTAGVAAARLVVLAWPRTELVRRDSPS